MEAGRTIRALGYTKIDAMSPFPVHGIDEAIGVPYSKIGWIAVCGALTGILTAQSLVYWVGAVNYPLIIGGKPLFDFTYSIPPTFELAEPIHPDHHLYMHLGTERFAAPVSSFDELPQRASRLR